jgi:hypothetical protein
VPLRLLSQGAHFLSLRTYLYRRLVIPPAANRRTLMKAFSLVLVLVLMALTASTVGKSQVAPPATATPVTFFADTFTEASNTNLTSHTSDSGASWTVNIDGGGPGPIVEGGTGVLIPLSVANWATVTANVTPPSADYDVDSTLKIYDNALVSGQFAVYRP